MPIGAQAWAYKRITLTHAARYRELYLEEKGDGVGSKHNARAQGRARVRLIREFRDDYQRLYREARDKGMPHNNAQARRNPEVPKVAQARRNPEVLKVARGIVRWRKSSGVIYELPGDLVVLLDHLEAAVDANGGLESPLPGPVTFNLT